MHGETEGKPFLHVRSLKNEGLLELDFQSGAVSLFIAFRPTSHREWERFTGYETQTYSRPLCLPAPSGQITATRWRPEWRRIDQFGQVQTFLRASNRPNFRMFCFQWLQGGQPCNSVVTSIGVPRKVGKYSGLRWWWRCPRCGRNASALYFAHAPMGCRICHDLVYRSERLSRKQRIVNRANPALALSRNKQAHETFKALESK
jgi:hypothetical protein